jgi:hypothetical protein
MIEALLMQKGFNSDINARGMQFHVQTEDWGQDNPYLVSRVFCNGAVVKTLKTSYVDALKNQSIKDNQAIQQALRHQHNQVIDQIYSGQIG